jgi:hypothetical protein
MEGNQHRCDDEDNKHDHLVVDNAFVSWKKRISYSEGQVQEEEAVDRDV